MFSILLYKYGMPLAYSRETIFSYGYISQPKKLQLYQVRLSPPPLPIDALTTVSDGRYWKHIAGLLGHCPNDAAAIIYLKVKLRNKYSHFHSNVG